MNVRRGDVRSEIKESEVKACAVSKEPSCLTAAIIVKTAKVANGVKSIGMFAEDASQKLEKLPSKVYRDLHQNICHKSNFRKWWEVLISTFLNDSTILDRVELKPSILTAFISPSILEVTDIRFCTLSTHAFWLTLEVTDIRDMAKTHTVFKLVYDSSSSC